MTRRELAAGLAACVGAAALPREAAAGGTTTVPVPFPEGTAYLLLPDPAPAGRLPLLVALHGRGEARKGPERGGLGWPTDYALTAMIARVAAPPVTAADLGGFADPARLAAQNAALAARPYGGLAIACPYVPDLEMYDDAALDAYGAFLVGRLLPRLRADLPVTTDPAATGLDGVSLGGRLALHAGLGAPDHFGAVGAIQPALRAAEVPSWVARARAARAARPGLALRLLTSDGDFFRAPVEALSAALTAAGLPHERAVLPGPHDSAFNRGPGALELLLFADRALRR